MFATMPPGRMHAMAVRPAPALERAVRTLYGDRKMVAMAQAMDDVVAIDALAKLLDRALAVATNKGGHLDLRDMAAFMLREIREANR